MELISKKRITPILVSTTTSINTETRESERPSKRRKISESGTKHYVEILNDQQRTLINNVTATSISNDTILHPQQNKTTHPHPSPTIICQSQLQPQLQQYQPQSQLQSKPQFQHQPQRNPVHNQSDNVHCCRSYIMMRLLSVLKNSYKKDSPAQLKKRIMSTFEEGRILT